MFDNHVAGMIEQRRFELALRFDVNDFDMDAVMAFGQGFDAVNNRRAVVVAVGEADGARYAPRKLQFRAP
jgi:hypothetical protein